MDHWIGRKSRGGDRWGETLERDHAFKRMILAIPAGKVSTYGTIAESAGYPRYHRAVARLLRGEQFDRLPWHRVVGADGAIKVSGAAAKEQRARLRQEGVSFQGVRVNLSVFLHRPGNAADTRTEEWVLPRLKLPRATTDPVRKRKKTYAKAAK